jgi:DNA-binding PadR family transcriptional regulator
VLAERPFRFRALHTRLVTHIGEHVDDNALTRSLHRLRRSGLIRADSKHVGSRSINTYTLSDKGRVHLIKYEALVCVFTHTYTSEEGCDSGCRVHQKPGSDGAA